MSSKPILLEITRAEEIEVAYLKVDAGVRYWEDATVDGAEDRDGSLIPLRDGDRWRPTIELATGRIENWPEGTKAQVWYKVCDDGNYWLLDRGRSPVAAREDNYVPEILCPRESGYGDYIIMDVGPNGVIAEWSPTLDQADWSATG